MPKIVACNELLPRGEAADKLEGCWAIGGVKLFRTEVAHHQEGSSCMLISRSSTTWGSRLMNQSPCHSDRHFVATP